jgi:hypothetical protein
MKKLIAWMLILMLAMGCACAETFIPEGTTLLPLDEKIEIDLDSDGGVIVTPKQLSESEFLELKQVCGMGI